MKLTNICCVALFPLAAWGAGASSGNAVQAVPNAVKPATYEKACQIVEEWIDQIAGKGELPSNKLSNLQQALKALSQGADIHGREGRRTLMASAALGRKDIFDFLLGRGAVPGKGEKLNALFREAVCGKNAAIAEWLFKQGADVNSAGRMGSTPLMLAACRNDRDMVDLLLGWKADPDAVNEQGETAADYALGSGCRELGQYLKSNMNRKGADQ